MIRMLLKSFSISFANLKLVSFKAGHLADSPVSRTALTKPNLLDS